MRRQNNRFRRFSSIEKEKTCSCGTKVRLNSRRNYPFGKKSKARTMKFYKCKNCGKMEILSKVNNGGRR